jgi:hypothetical protein
MQLELLTTKETIRRTANKLFLDNIEIPVSKRPRPSAPQEGISLAAATEERAVHVRRAVALLAEGFDATKLPQSFSSIFAPRWELDLGVGKNDSLNVRAAWNLVCTWLLARGSGVINPHTDFSDGEDWFVGNTVQTDRLSSILAYDSKVEARQELSKVQIDEDFWDLFPYILEEHGPGSRASVLRDPSTNAARSAKKNNGVFYTPSDIADYMTKQVLKNYTGDISNAKCIDTSCGTGVFLLSMASAAEDIYSAKGAAFDRFTYVVNNLFGCDISPHAVDACAFVLLRHCRKDVAKRGLAPWSAWHAIRLNLAAADSLMLAPGKNDSTPDTSLSVREKQKQALLESAASRPDPLKEKLGKKGSCSAQSLFPNRRTVRIGELFAEAAGGFDLLIGNPPYSYLGNREDFDLLTDEYQSFHKSQAGPAANLFLPFIEMMWRLTVPSRKSAALVTPLSIAYNTGSHYVGCRAAMMRQGGRWQFAFFDREPHALFGEDVKTRNAILFHIENETTPQRSEAAEIETGSLRKWTSRTRNKLFESIRFTNIGASDVSVGIPKVEGPLQAAALASLNSSRHALQSFSVRVGKCKVADALNSNCPNHVYVGGTAYNFLNAFLSFSVEVAPEAPLSESPVHCLEFSSERDAFVAYSILNSRVIFWLWHVQADGFHVSSRFIRSIPFDRRSFGDEQLSRLAKLGGVLWEKVQTHRFSSINGGRLTYTFRPLSCNEERDEIDSILVEAGALPSGFKSELKAFVRKTVTVDENDDKRRHLTNYFLGGVDLCAAN